MLQWSFVSIAGTGEWRQCTADPQGEAQASSDEDSVHICQAHTTRQTAPRAHSRSRTGEFVRTARTLDKRTRLDIEVDLDEEAQQSASSASIPA